MLFRSTGKVPYRARMALERGDALPDEFLHHHRHRHLQPLQPRQPLPDTRRWSESFSWPQQELGEAGAPGFRSWGLYVPASMSSHCFQNLFAVGESSKLIPEPAVAATASKVMHPEHWRASTNRSKKKWRNRATEGVCQPWPHKGRQRYQEG